MTVAADTNAQRPCRRSACAWPIRSIVRSSADGHRVAGSEAVEDVQLLDRRRRAAASSSTESPCNASSSSSATSRSVPAAPAATSPAERSTPAVPNVRAVQTALPLEGSLVVRITPDQNGSVTDQDARPAWLRPHATRTLRPDQRSSPEDEVQPVPLYTSVVLVTTRRSRSESSLFREPHGRGATADDRGLPRT